MEENNNFNQNIENTEYNTDPVVENVDSVAPNTDSVVVESTMVNSSPEVVNYEPPINDNAPIGLETPSVVENSETIVKPIAEETPTVENTTPEVVPAEQTPQETKKKNVLLYVIIGAILVAAVAGYFFIFK